MRHSHVNEAIEKPKDVLHGSAHRPGRAITLAIPSLWKVMHVQETTEEIVDSIPYFPRDSEIYEDRLRCATSYALSKVY